MNENASDDTQALEQAQQPSAAGPPPLKHSVASVSATPVETAPRREPTSSDRFAAQVLAVLSGLVVGPVAVLAFFTAVGFPVAIVHHYLIPWEPVKVVGFGFATLVGLGGGYSTGAGTYWRVYNRLLFGTWHREADVTVRFVPKQSTADQAGAVCSDTNEPCSGTPGSSTAARATYPDTAAECYAQILTAHREQMRDPLIYLKPNIPKPKLRNAIAAYAPDADPKSALVLIDATVFGNAKTGLLLTTTALYAHSTFGAMRCFDLQNIEEVTFGGGFLGKLHVGDDAEFDMGGVSSNAMCGFAAMMADLVAAARHYGPPTPGAAQNAQTEAGAALAQAESPGAGGASQDPAFELLRQLKQLHSEGVLSEEEFTEKKGQLLASLGK